MPGRVAALVALSMQAGWGSSHAGAPMRQFRKGWAIRDRIGGRNDNRLGMEERQAGAHLLQALL
eukprot:1146978-Pelagomonas_calceolata.AAC.3